MTIGEKIYEYRTAKNLSQGDLADMLEVSRQSVSKWENNAAVPDLDKIIKLSEIFGISIDELVKGEKIVAPEEPKAKPAAIKKESSFPPRKIIGTVLLSLSAVITVGFFAIGLVGGSLIGLLLSSPLILCGIICFAFKRNIGLWCSWAVFFCADMYLRIATGTNSSVILNLQSLLLYVRGGEFVRLILAFIQFSAILSLTLITVLRFKKIPLESKKQPIIFWAAYAVLKIAMAIFAVSHLYRQIMNYVLSTMNTGFYVFFHSVYVWIYTGFFVAAVVLTVRYIVTKKHKNI